MPHLILRHSDNLSNYNFTPLLKNLHELLVSHLNCKLTSCSSMVISHSQYLIGDGDINNAFIHLDIKSKPLTENNIFDLISSDSLEILKSYMSTSKLKIKISVDCKNVTQFFKSQ